MKRFFSLLMVLCLMLTVLPFGASAARGGKLVALTFDDGPSSSLTPKLLDGLKARGAKVTFFTLGQSANSNLDIIRREYEEGHEVACHSWDHPDLNSESNDEVSWQVNHSIAVLDKICGDDADYLFRAPYGNANERVRSLINYPLIYWSVDTNDWKDRNSDIVCNRIVNGAFDGAIILCHDIHSTTIPGALRAIDILQDRGYEFVTVSELFRRRGVELQDHVWHYDCKPNGTDYGPIPAPTFTNVALSTSEAQITIFRNSGAPIYYTTDGSYPNADSKVYTGPFTVTYPCTIRAVAAYDPNGSRSETVTYGVSSPTAIRPNIGMKDHALVMTSPTKGADVAYTLDGSDPVTNGTVYTGPVTPSGACEIRAVSTGSHLFHSAETRMSYSARGQLYADMTPSDWFYEPIDRMVSEGLMAGVGNYRMAPRAKLTRGMLVRLLQTYSGDKLGDNNVTNPFTDVSRDQYYAQSVEWAYRNGVMNGYPDNTFRPDQNISREELCVVVTSFLRARGHELPAGESCEGKFADYDQISSWALESIEAMVAKGMLSGDGTKIYPKGSTSRAEAAAIIVQMMNYEASF